MNAATLVTFFRGALAMSCGVAALLFWRFFTLTRDRLFAFFSVAFVVFGAHWVGLGLANPTDDVRHFFYVVRLVAFVVIIVGIVDKNRREA